LANSNTSLSKRFHVVVGGYEPGFIKKGTIEETLNGHIDYSVGSIQQMENLIIRVKHTSDDVNFGSVADLKTLFSLNNPNGTPSNVITYTDHWGVSHSIYLIGSFEQSLLTTTIDGVEAVSLIKITLRFIP
jgi:hypothetical protein